MNALPVKTVDGLLTPCHPAEATHLILEMPGPCGRITVQIPGVTSEGWDWNRDTESPTLRPSLLTEGVDAEGRPYSCHSYVTEGEVHFLPDSTHALAGKTLPLNRVPWAPADEGLCDCCPLTARRVISALTSNWCAEEFVGEYCDACAFAVEDEMRKIVLEENASRMKQTP